MKFKFHAAGVHKVKTKTLTMDKYSSSPQNVQVQEPEQHDENSDGHSSVDEEGEDDESHGKTKAAPKAAAKAAAPKPRSAFLLCCST